MSDSAEEPKLIIDEDWKTQVQREKEELKQKLGAAAAEESSAAAAPTNPGEPTASGPVAGESIAGESIASKQAAGERAIGDDDGPQFESPPPASLTLLVTTLATQAMAAMGLMPSEEDEQPPPVNLDFAKHFVDMLSVLEEKTRGNLNDTEKNYLNEALHQLRMTFVAVSKQHRT